MISFEQDVDLVRCAFNDMASGDFYLNMPYINVLDLAIAVTSNAVQKY
jgi:hypothetical protein